MAGISFKKKGSRQSMMLIFKEVDTKWLGLRFAHRGSLLPETDSDALARPPSSDFDMLMCRLLRNMNIAWSDSWFQELKHLKKYHKFVDFPSSGALLLYDRQHQIALYSQLWATALKMKNKEAFSLMKELKFSLEKRKLKPH